MRPTKATLRGFTGIKRGMGIDEVTLDISKLSGLIAFDGENGRGKTTILDNLHPYRRLASREGSLQHHVFLRDSYKEYCFEIDNSHYRTLVKIDAQSGRQEGYVWKDGESQVSGKATEYDRYIEDLIGSPKLFFHSAFAAQGGKSVADLTEGQIKKLYSEFLQLDRLARFSEDAKQAGNVIADQIKALRQRMAAAEEQVAAKAGLEKQMSEKDSRMSAKKTEAERIKTRIDAASAKLEKAREAAAGHRAAEQRRLELAREKTGLEKQLKSSRDTWTRREKDIEAKLEKARKAIAEKKSAMEGRRLLEGMKNELRDLEKETPEKERGMNNAAKKAEFVQDRIEEKTRELNGYIATTAKSVEAQQSRIDDISAKAREIERRRAEIDNQIKALEKDEELTRLSYRLKELETTAAKKDMLPAECDSGICPFVADARKAGAELENVRRQHDKRSAEVRNQLNKIRANEARSVEWDASENKVFAKKAAARKKQLAEQLEQGKASINAQIAKLAETRDAAREDAQKRQREIQEIKKRQSKLRSQIDNMPNYETLEAEVKSLNDRIAELAEDHSRHRVEYERQVADIKSRLSEIDSAISSLLLDPKAEEVARAKTRELETARQAAKENDAEIASLHSDVAVLRHRIAECAEAEKNLASDRRSETRLNGDLAEWRYIQQACGKDGLQALEIDGTAPMIAQYANNLLTATFGPGSTVGFRTIDDEGRECLDVVVYRDGDKDEKGTLLKNLSGGEKVWVLKALRLALTLVSKLKSGRDIAAVLADEEDGALDEDNSVAFISLYQAFMEAGGFVACLYITHKDTCKQMADHVVKFADGGINIESNSVATRAA